MARRRRGYYVRKPWDGKNVWVTSVSVRCQQARGGGCNYRTRLPYMPDSYKKIKRCPKCNSYLRVDYYRMFRESHRRGVCKCNAWPFPHHKKSKGCDQNPATTDAERAANAEEHEHQLRNMYRKKYRDG